MKRAAICVLAFLWLGGVLAYGDDANHYYDLGLKSSTTNTKIRYFTKVLELDPSFVAAYERRGMLYYFQEKYDEMIHDYRKYLDLAPEKAEAFLMLGVGYLKSGFYEPAVLNFTRAIEMEPQFAAAYANRAEAYRLSGKDDDAIREAGKALELSDDPRTRADAYRTRARVYQKIGLVQLAAADSTAAMSIDPRIPRFWGRRYFYRYASPEELSKAGLIALIGIAFVLIFKLTLKPPKKDD